MTHKRTCYSCNKIYETKYYFSFFCENCCMAKIDLIDRRRKGDPIGVCSYSGYVGYLKYILKQPNWVNILNSSESKEFTHSKF